MYINQHSEVSFCYRTHFHLIAFLVHLLASVNAERTCVYVYEVAQVAVSKNWCHPVNFQPSDFARSYYIFIYSHIVFVVIVAVVVVLS